MKFHPIHIQHIYEMNECDGECKRIFVCEFIQIQNFDLIQLILLTSRMTNIRNEYSYLLLNIILKYVEAHKIKYIIDYMTYPAKNMTDFSC